LAEALLHDVRSAAYRQIERSEALLYGSDAIEFMLRDIESRHAEIILVLCFIVPLIFVLVLIALNRVRTLRKRVDELTHSVRGLINEQEACYTRELLGRTKDKGPG
jgi:hypothetical protein